MRNSRCGIGAAQRLTLLLLLLLILILILLLILILILLLILLPIPILLPISPSIPSKLGEGLLTSPFG